MSRSAAIHPFPNPSRAVRRGSTHPSAGGHRADAASQRGDTTPPGVTGRARDIGVVHAVEAVPPGVGRSRPQRHPPQRRASWPGWWRPAGLMAVVKADGYGHGSVAAAYAALEAGATWLGVALVEEGVELRDAGIDMPILLLSQPPVRSGPGGRRRRAHPRGLQPPVRRRPGQGRGRRRASTRTPSTSRSTPACTGSAARRARRSTSPRPSGSTGNCTSRGCSPTSRWPTSRTTPTPPRRWPPSRPSARSWPGWASARRWSTPPTRPGC